MSNHFRKNVQRHEQQQLGRMLAATRENITAESYGEDLCKTHWSDGTMQEIKMTVLL